MPIPSFVRVSKRLADGRLVEGVATHPIKPHTRHYWLVDPDNDTVTLTAQGTAADHAEIRFLIDTQGHFDWAYIIGASTGAYTLDFFDNGTQHKLSNHPVHSNTVVGSALRPFRLPEPYFFNVGDSQRELIVTVRNLTAVNNVIRLAMVGRRFYHRESPPDVSRDITAKFDKGWRTYSYFLVPKETAADGTVVAVGANGTSNFTIESDDSADTELQKFMFASTGNFLFRIKEVQFNRYLSPDWIINTAGWGNAEFPFYLADSLLLERRKQLIVEVTDISGVTNSIYLTAAGRRLQLF